MFFAATLARDQPQGRVIVGITAAPVLGTHGVTVTGWGHKQVQTPSPLMSFSDQRRSSQLTLMLHVHHLGQPTPFACPSTRHVTLEGQETG